ncbi:ABC transporter substrate-binding protein [Paenibacillus terrigena]|uniref:ABC transporter substrate-binding protein n=1 Tax=Paenibacillus terrigena TaxID=369333 RepID=UPI0028D3C20C|nr:ABC transporter substrate-binding protein [Paenibacillus terrigena]
MHQLKPLKLFAVTLVALLSISGLIGCSAQKDQPTGGDNKEQADAPKKDITITFVGSQNWLNKGSKIDSELNEAFTQETGIKVDMQVIPDDQYANVLKTKLASGEAPDIFMVSAGVGAQKFLPDKYFADLSNEKWVSRYVPYAKAGSTIDGKVMGFMTWSVDGWGMLYNTKVFEKNNLTVPKTFDEFTKTLDILKVNNITPVYEVGKEAWHWGIWLSQMGPIAEKNNPGLYEKLNSNQIKYADVKEFETFLTQFKEMYDKGYFGKNPISNTWDSGYEAMGKEQAASFLGYTSYQNEVAGKFADSGANDWKMFPIPMAGNNVFSHSAGGNMRVAYKDSKNLDSVKAFFDFLARPDNLKKYYEARPDIQPAPSFTDVPAKPTASGKSLLENAPGGDGMDMEYGVLYWDNTTVGKYIQDMMLGGLTPKQVLESIDKDRAKLFSATAK